METRNGFEKPLTAAQKAALWNVADEVRAGAALCASCRKWGIRYETALRGLRLPTGGATVTSADLKAAVAGFFKNNPNQPRR